MSEPNSPESDPDDNEPGEAPTEFLMDDIFGRAITANGALGDVLLGSTDEDAEDEETEGGDDGEKGDALPANLPTET
jgi:hypothetical protein